MKNKYKVSIIVAVVLIVLVLGGFIARDKYNTSTGGGVLLNKSNNTICFNYPIMAKYAHISISIDNNSEITDGVKYKITNPDGEVKDKGTLLKEEIKRFTYDKGRGDWKIEFNFEENQEAFINYDIKLDSKK